MRVIIITLLIGCSSPAVNNGGQALIDCGKADITGILSDVAKVIAAGDTNWKTVLEQIGIEVGQDVLACAVQTVEVVLKASSNPNAEKASSFIAGRRFSKTLR